jgi:NADH dehydrogenase
MLDHCKFHVDGFRSAGQTDPSARVHRVVVVGGGFGGLEAVKALRGARLDVTLVDRNNYFLFQPLTYQVATGSLSSEDIAEPLRKIFRSDGDVRVVMGDVTAVDLERQVVSLDPPLGSTDPQIISFDTLIVAAGSSYAYFGHDEWSQVSLEVKSLDDALETRARILAAFERAELEPDPDRRAEWLTFLVVGGGPTGVETAGQVAELARDTLPRDFREHDPGLGRVLLVEMDDRVLPTFPAVLSERAERSLQELGVTCMTGRAVVGIAADGVTIRGADGEADHVPARTVIWAAGVQASPLAGILADAAGAEVDRAGRVIVEPDLTLAGHASVLGLGDMVCIRNPRSGTAEALPGVAPVAIQQGRYAGRLVRNRLAGRSTPPFHYVDKGNLATIGRARAVADLRGIRIGGSSAWLLWLLVHIIYLIGFENRAVVLLRWSVNFLTQNRGARVIPERAEVSNLRRRMTTQS